MNGTQQDDVAKMTVDLVKDYLKASGQTMSPQEFVAFLRQVRESLEGGPSAGKPATEAAPAAGSPPAETDAGAGKVPGATGGEDDAAGDVVPGLARGLLRQPGQTYARQRNALTEGPAVDPAKSYTDEYILCLEDGVRVKFLRRHLQSHYGMTVEEYLHKWGLPADYPLVPKNYIKRRRRMLEEMKRAEAGKPPKYTRAPTKH